MPGIWYGLYAWYGCFVEESERAVGRPVTDSAASQFSTRFLTLARCQSVREIGGRFFVDGFSQDGHSICFKRWLKCALGIKTHVSKNCDDMINDLFLLMVFAH